MSMMSHRHDLSYIHIFFYHVWCLFCIFVFIYAQGLPYSHMFESDHFSKLRFIQKTPLMNIRTVSTYYRVLRDWPKDLGPWYNLFFFANYLYMSITWFHFVIIPNYPTTILRQTLIF